MIAAFAHGHGVRALREAVPKVRWGATRGRSLRSETPLPDRT